MISVVDLNKTFDTPSGTVNALTDVRFTVESGEILGFTVLQVQVKPRCCAALLCWKGQTQVRYGLTGRISSAS